MKRILIDNAWNIWKIAEANGVEANTGMNYFQSNMEYHGRADVPVFQGAVDADYAKLSAIWRSMTPEDRHEATNFFVRANNALDEKLIPLFNAGDRAGFEALFSAYDEAEEPKEE